MKRTSLVGGVIVAATLTLIAVGGPAHASSALSGPVYAQSTWIVPVQPGVPDVILALSDMVDLERIIKDTGPEAREKFKTHISKPVVLETRRPGPAN